MKLLSTSVSVSRSDSTPFSCPRVQPLSVAGRERNLPVHQRVQGSGFVQGLSQGQSRSPTRAKEICHPSGGLSQHA